MFRNLHNSWEVEPIAQGEVPKPPSHSLTEACKPSQVNQLQYIQSKCDDDRFDKMQETVWIHFNTD